jgi:very-short-patch-repair endonuclease
MAAGEGLRLFRAVSKLIPMRKRHIQIARRLRADSTSSEDTLWQCLRSRRLDGLKFRRQVPIAGFIADFCCYDLGLTIELDGKHHLDQLERDAARRELIELHGYIELRFTNDDVKERLDWVIEEIRCGIDVARGLPQRPAFPRFE